MWSVGVIQLRIICCLLAWGCMEGVVLGGIVTLIRLRGGICLWVMVGVMFMSVSVTVCRGLPVACRWCTVGSCSEAGVWVGMCTPICRLRVSFYSCPRHRSNIIMMILAGFDESFSMAMRYDPESRRPKDERGQLSIWSSKPYALAHLC